MEQNAGGFSMEGLLKNKLFLQYLAAAGQDISSGKPIGANVNAVTQQNIGAQNQAALQQKYIKMLSDMIGSKMPGWSASADDKGMKFNVPSNAFSNLDSSLNKPLEGNNGEKQAAPVSPSASQGLINPFVSSQPVEFSGSELAGMNPEDVTRALSAAISTSDLVRQSTATDALDGIYPIPLPGGSKVTHRQWQSLPKSQKEYAIYAHSAKLSDEKDIMTEEEFKLSEPTMKEKFLRKAMADPKLMEAQKELNRSGSLVFTSEEAAKKAGMVAQETGDVKAWQYISNGAYVKDLDKYISSTEVRRKLQGLVADETDPIKYQKKYEVAKAQEKASYIRKQIIAKRGKIVDEYLDDDGKTAVFVVKSPTGKSETIKHVIFD